MKFAVKQIPAKKRVQECCSYQPTEVENSNEVTTKKQ